MSYINCGIDCDEKCETCKPVECDACKVTKMNDGEGFIILGKVFCEACMRNLHGLLTVSLQNIDNKKAQEARENAGKESKLKLCLQCDRAGVADCIDCTL